GRFLRADSCALVLRSLKLLLRTGAGPALRQHHPDKWQRRNVRRHSQPPLYSPFAGARPTLQCVAGHSLRAGNEGITDVLYGGCAFLYYYCRCNANCSNIASHTSWFSNRSSRETTRELIASKIQRRMRWRTITASS